MDELNFLKTHTNQTTTTTKTEKKHKSQFLKWNKLKKNDLKKNKNDPLVY